MNIRLTRRIEALEKRQPTAPTQNAYLILPCKDDTELEELEENPSFEERGPGIYAVLYRPEPGIEEEIDRRIAELEQALQKQGR